MDQLKLLLLHHSPTSPLHVPTGSSPQSPCWIQPLGDYRCEHSLGGRLQATSPELTLPLPAPPAPAPSPSVLPPALPPFLFLLLLILVPLLLLFLLCLLLLCLLLFLLLILLLLLLCLLYLHASCVSIHHEQKAALHSAAAVFLWATQIKEKTDF